MGFDHGLQLVNVVSVLNGFLAHFMAIFSCFWSFFAAYLCNVSTFVVCLKQFLPLLSNLQVNFNELANIYPTALYPPNIYIANLVFCLVIYLYIYGQSYTKQSYFPKYSKGQFRHFACFYVYIFIFNPHFACSS